MNLPIDPHTEVLRKFPVAGKTYAGLQLIVSFLIYVRCLCLQEIKLIIPNSQRINRGNYEIKQLMDACRSNNVTDFIMLRETRGVPGE
jgi:hypothetical protein